MYFEMPSFDICPVYTNSFMYIFSDLKTSNAQFGIFTSFSHHFCTNLRINVIAVIHLYMLTKIIWLSYLHTKTAKILQKKYSIEVIRRKRILCIGFTVIYNIHFKIFRKSSRVRQFLHCDTNTKHFLVYSNYCKMRGKH